MKNLILSVLSIVTLTFAGCSNVENLDNQEVVNVNASRHLSDAAGFLYTTTNGQSINQVVRFHRMPDGSLINETAFSTNSLGGANIAAGGDAFGDFDSQGAIQIIGDYLLNVNAGGNEISVFALDRSNGNLTFKSNTSSGGTRPVSITYTPVGNSPHNYWVVVGNQWNNPNVQKTEPNIERYPNDAFHMMDLTQPDATDQERNIRLFRFNTQNGKLKSAGRLDTYVRENGGPTCVTFSDDGSKLAVSTWGIAHFLTDSPSLDEQHPSRVYVYDFKNGKASNGRYFEEEGIAGTIGINWAKGSNSILHVSNFNTTIAKANNSLTILSDNGASVTKSANYATGAGEDLDEACWTVLNPAGDRLYVASFNTNVITPFTIGASGNVTNTLAFTSRGGLMPNGDSKDVFVTADNQYLYNTGAFQSFSMNIFDINNSGVTYREQIILQTTASGAGQPGAFNFLGLTGFDR